MTKRKRSKTKSRSTKVQSLLRVISNKITNKVGLNFGNVYFGNSDILSYDSIKNCKDITALEEDFSDRLSFSEWRLTEKYLPAELKSDFKITSKKDDGGSLKYTIKPITQDAYKKFPPSIDFELKFRNQDELKKFLDNGGIEGLIEEAELTQKPVEIPHVVKTGEHIGKYKNPIPFLEDGEAKIFIKPRPLPPARKFILRVCGGGETFELKTQLRLRDYGKEQTVFLNRESNEEKVDLKIVLPGLNDVRNWSSKNAALHLQITISVRKGYEEDIEANELVLKYISLTSREGTKVWLIDEFNSEIAIEFGELTPGEISIQKNTELKRRIELIEKLKYISAIKSIGFKYDSKSLLSDGTKIDYVYNECQGENLESSGNFSTSIKIPDSKMKADLLDRQGGDVIIDGVTELTIMGKKVTIKPTRIVMEGCKICDEPEDEFMRIIYKKVKFLLS